MNGRWRTFYATHDIRTCSSVPARPVPLIGVAWWVGSTMAEPSTLRGKLGMWMRSETRLWTAGGNVKRALFLVVTRYLGGTLVSVTGFTGDAEEPMECACVI